jgi:hypothetical protein
VIWAFVHILLICAPGQIVTGGHDLIKLWKVRFMNMRIFSIVFESYVILLLLNSFVIIKSKSLQPCKLTLVLWSKLVLVLRTFDQMLRRRPWRHVTGLVQSTSEVRRTRMQRTIILKEKKIWKKVFNFRIKSLPSTLSVSSSTKQSRILQPIDELN